MISYVLGLIAGLAQPTQTSFNGRLTDRTGSPYITSVISFTVSLICLLILVAVIEGGINIPFAAIAAKPWWIWLGGLCGTGIVILSVVCLPYIGSAMTVIMTAFGQIVMSLVVDQFGWFESPRMPMTATRAAGALLVAVGVVLCSMPKKDPAGEKKKYPIRYIGLAFFVGLLCGTQIGINGTLGRVAGSGWVGTLVSMSVGFLSTAVLTIIVFLIKGKKGMFGDAEKVPFKWYMLLGGTMGVVVVSLNSIISPIIGAGMATIMNLIGFMTGGLVIDAVGFLGIEKKPITVRKIAGVLIMLGGTAVISLI